MNRIQQLVERLPAGIDAALITSDVNRRYYTGFASSAGTVLVTRSAAWLYIDSRYFEAAERSVKGFQVELQQRLAQQVLAQLQASGVHTLAVESETMTLQEFATWREKLEGVELVGDKTLSTLISRQRRIKSKEEIDAIRQAQAISDETFSYIVQHIKPGVTEQELALAMEFYSRELGSEGPAFSFIVASGKNSSLPHAVPTNKQVERGDLITMDFGSIINGYCSDMTRTVAVGEVNEKQRDVYNTVLEAQLAALQQIEPGRICNDIDRTARKLIDSRYKGRFGHGLGHSLGLEIHEEPRFGTSDQTVLEPGIVMSVEPGIYLPGEFGVRIEDIVVITEGGCDNLVTSPKELLVL